MKKSDFYDIIVKLFGLYTLYLSIKSLGQAVSSYFFYIQIQGEPEFSNGISDIKTSIYGNLVICAILAIIGSIVMIRSQVISKVICGKQASNESISLGMDQKSIYEIALITAGLLLIVWNLPNFIYHFKNYIALLSGNNPSIKKENGFITLFVIQVAIGLISIFYAGQISSLLTKRIAKKN